VTDLLAMLLPAPRSLVREQGELTLKNHHHLRIFDETASFPRIVDQLRRDIRRLLRITADVISADSEKGAAATIVLRRNFDLRAQGYRLHITMRHVVLEFADEAGAFYGAMTLRQLIRLFKESLPACRIEDHPDFPARGVMLDISRDKVPTLDTLFMLVDEFAEWKINHLELYMEHTFAYSRHRVVWEEASPLTPDEIRALDAHCRARHVELVANQNTFGHMHRWLKHARYRDLAECPDGFLTPWNERRTVPFSLNPLDPRSLALVREMLGELLPNFTSRLVNVGCDETFDLGQGRSRDVCAERGKGRVYLDYLLAVHAIVGSLGGRMMFWGDIILHHPELIPEIPRDVLALVWGYEADHPFATQCAAFAASRVPFFVCPGTSAWNSIAGRLDNALANLRSAAVNGRAAGAAGYLVTDWGDNGHWQTLPVSYLPLTAGAAWAWCGESFDDEAWLDAVSHHVFLDDTREAVDALRALGNAHQDLAHPIVNASPVFRLLHDNDPASLASSIAAERLARLSASSDDIASSVARSRLQREDGDLVKSEIVLTARMVRHASLRALALQSAPNAPSRAALLSDINEILAEYRRVWLARNREGGMGDSMRRIVARRADYQGPTGA
jgi:hypothetical protein